jgi:hypothetical protein
MQVLLCDALELQTLTRQTTDSLVPVAGNASHCQVSDRIKSNNMLEVMKNAANFTWAVLYHVSCVSSMCKCSVLCGAAFERNIHLLSGVLCYVMNSGKLCCHSLLARV